MASIIERVRKAWNAFNNKDPTGLSRSGGFSYSSGSSYRPGRERHTRITERMIIAPILNKIAVDAASITIRHVQLDEKKRFKEVIESGLNFCLNTEANIDQAGQALLQDVYYSMLDEGVVALVPTEADEVSADGTRLLHASVTSFRTGRITRWYPKEIDVEVYNEETGETETLRMPKRLCPIVENPFWQTMNEPNSNLQRLRQKLMLLDKLDSKTVDGKLDLIIQLPYTTRTTARRAQAEIRRKDIEMQLAGSKYGVAYTDASERVIQLNRPLENNLLPQIQDLKKDVYDQIGMTDGIMNNSAGEQEQLGYTNGILLPIVSALVNELNRKCLTDNARSRGQAVRFFRDQFKLVPIGTIAEIGDPLTRNEILTSNELRGMLGFPPSAQPSADELRNKNMPYVPQETVLPEEDPVETEEYPDEGPPSI